MISEENKFENYHHVPLSEFLKTVDPRHANWQICIDKPYLFIRHVTETSSFLDELVKKQLSEIDPLKEPEAHEALSSIAKDIYKFYKTSQSLGIDYYLTIVSKNLEVSITSGFLSAEK